MPGQADKPGSANDRRATNPMLSGGSRDATRHAAGLTRREVQILALVAAGLSNKQVAGELGLSVYTIETHLRSVFAKLKVPNRTAAARFAIDNDLC